MKQRNNRQVWDSLILVFQFGINMIVPIVMCTLIGVWIGDKFDISWIVIPLFFMGALAGGQNIYRMTKKMYQKHNGKGKKNAEKNE